MKLTQRGIIVLIVLPLAAAGLFIGSLPLSMGIRSMNGASLLGVVLIAAAGWVAYEKVLQE